MTLWPSDTPTALKVYGTALVEVAQERPEIVCIGTDLTKPTETDLFRDVIPDRFFNVGMAEANAVGIAAGMARCGETPFVNTFGVFASRRAFDQIAMQVAYPKTNVKVVGFTPGLTSPGGVTHQSIEDLALMRALPNMVVVEPADANEIRAVVRAVADHDGPAYLRIKRDAVPVIEGVGTDFEIGRAELVRDGDDLVIFACGLMVTLALDAASGLADEGCSAAVVNVSTLKPLDTALVTEIATKTGRVVTAENHSVIGGLGSAVADALFEAGVCSRLVKVGIRDTFAEGASALYLFEKHGLTATAIGQACRNVLRAS